MLKTISLNRFKRFNEVEVVLQPFTALMGENSSGKTTIIQAINLGLSTISTFKLVSTDASGKIKIRPKGVGLTSLVGINLSDFRELYYAKISRSGSGAGAASIDLKDERGSDRGER